MLQLGRGQILSVFHPQLRIPSAVPYSVRRYGTIIFSMHLSHYSLHCVEEITTIAFLNGISGKGVVSAMIDVEQSRSIISAG